MYWPIAVMFPGRIRLQRIRLFRDVLRRLLASALRWRRAARARSPARRREDQRERLRTNTSSDRHRASLPETPAEGGQGFPLRSTGRVGSVSPPMTRRSKILEPEVMDTAGGGRDYDAMDHVLVNERFCGDLLEQGHGPSALDVGTGTARIPIEVGRRTPESGSSRSISRRTCSRSRSRTSPCRDPPPAPRERSSRSTRSACRMGRRVRDDRRTRSFITSPITGGARRR